MANYDELAGELFPDTSGSKPQSGPLPATEANVYDGVADQLFGAQRSAVHASMYNAQQIDPDQQAEALRLAQKRGLPTATVRENLDEVRRQEELEAIDYDGLIQQNPALAKWLAVPDNAAVARDSVGALDTVGKILTPVGDVLRSAPAGAVKAAGMTLSGAGTLIDTAARAMDRGYRTVFGDAAADAVWIDAPWWLNPTEILRRPGEQLEAGSEVIGAPAERQNLATDISGGVGQIGFQIATLLATGGTLSTGMLFAQGADQQYDRAQEAGATQEQTDTAVMVGGAVTAVTEKYGLDRLLDRVPPQIKNRVMRTLADAFAAGGVEAVQEATEGALQNLTEMAIYNPNQPLFEGLERDAAAAGGSGFVARLVINAILPGRQAQRAQDMGQKFTEADTAVDGVPLRERSPEKFQEVLGEQLKASGRDQVFMPIEQWETLFQSQGIDPAQAYAEMTGGDGTAYVEAAATRSDLRIPYAAYLAKLDPEVRKKLTPHLRLSPEDMTLAEAETFDQNRQQIMDGVNEAVRAGVESQQADPAYDAIYNDILGQLLTRFPRDVAEKYATAEAARFIAFNRLAGTDPLEDYQANTYKIRTEVPETLRVRSYEVELDPLLDRVRAGEIPTDEEIYGRSLVQFLADLGGIDDESMAGELRRLNESDRADRKGLPRLVRPGGLSLDDALVRAVEAGYFNEPDPDAPTQYGVNELLDALDNDMTGQRVYSMRDRNDALENLRRYMDDIQEFLGRSGVDLGAVDNETVKRILRGELIPEEIETPGEQIMDQAAPQTLDGIAEQARADGLKLDVSERDGVITLARIVVPEGQRGGGAGTRAMEQLTRYADATGQRIALSPSKDFGGNVKRLREFYARFGFKDNKGRSKDFAISETMIREPAAQSLNQSPIDTPEFEQWSRGADVYDPDELWNRYEGGPAVFKLYHGTTGDFTAFDPERANPESDMGAGFYFSNTPEDVGANYAGEGPDLTSKIARRAEQLFDELDVEERRAIVEEATGKKWEDLSYEEKRAPLADMARRELSVQNSGLTMPVFVRTENPAIVGGPNETELTFEESYDEEADEYGEPTGTLLQFVEALRTVGASDDFMDLDVEPAIAELMERALDGGMPLSDVIRILKASDGISQATDENGNLVSTEVIRRALESAGFDAIVDYTVDQKFGSQKRVGKAMEGMTDETVHVIAFNPTQIKSSIGNRGTYSDTDPNILNQPQQKQPGNRARISFTRGEDRAARNFTITLMEGADLSSFLHESGHYWLERLAAASAREGAPEQMRQMMQTLLDHWGLQSADQIEVKHHEDFARMNEAYLMEGKAPSLRLREVFARFRSWLLAIYKRLSALNVNLSPQVREVFDRLYATAEEIEQARAAQAATPLFRSREEAGMTEAEWAAYLNLDETARRQAEEDLANEVMEPIRREERKWWRDERRKVRAEVEAEVNRRKDFVALSVLRTGRMPDGTPVPAAPKLSKKSLMSDFDMTQAALKSLPRGIYSVDGGISADAASGMFGYPNGKALVEALATLPDKGKLIEEATDAEMRRRYPDVLEDGTVGERAVRAVHNDRQAELMVREAQVLAAKAGAAAQGKAAGLRRHQLSLQMAKAAADRVIEATEVRLLNPGKWKAAAAKAGNEAFRLALEGNAVDALRAKERQILNHALYRAATAAVERADKARDYLAKLASNKERRQRIGHAGGWEYVVRDATGTETVYESRKAAEAAVEERGGFYFATNTYLDQIDRLLEQYELRAVTNRKLERRENLREFVAGLERQGIPHAIPEEVMRDARSVSYREVPFGLFMALRDAVKSIETVAIKKNELLVAGEKRRLDETATAISESVRENAPGSAPAIGSASGGLLERIEEFGREGLALWLNPNYITREMDGAASGVVNQIIYRPVVDAEARRNQRKRQDTEAFAELMAKHYTPDELRAMARFTGKDAILVPELGVTWSKWDVISLAANWGNESNRLALLEGRYADGRQITQPMIHRLLGTAGRPGVLTAKDWAFVQDTWNFINRYKDEVAAAHQRRTGERLEMVQGDPFEVAVDGAAGPERITLAGGYYPLKYDPRQGTTAQQDDAADFFDTIKQGRGSVTQTKRGHTKERVGSGGRPVRIDFRGVVFGHLNEVITNLEMGDAVNAAWRVLQNGKVRSAFFAKGRKVYLEALDLWLKDVTVGEMPARGVTGKIFRSAKTNFTKALLTFKVATAVLQLTGYTQSIAVIGPAAMYRGIRQFASGSFEGRGGVKEQIMAMSPFMRERWDGGQFNPAVSDVLRASEGKPGLWLQGGYWMMGEMQKLVDAPTWLGAYDASMREHGDPKRAVSDADDAVERAQVGGQFGQRSGFLRGSTGLNEQQSEALKAFTALQSYMFAKGNIAYEQTRRTNFRKPTEVLKWTGRMAWLFAAEVMLLGLLKEILGDGWDDEDEDGAVWDDAAVWVAKEAVLGVAGIFPLAGMLSSELQGFRGNLPVQEIFKTTGQAVTQIQQGEPDAAFWKSLSSTVGMLTGAPSGQVNVAIDAYFRDQEGEVSPLEYIIKTENR